MWWCGGVVMMVMGSVMMWVMWLMSDVGDHCGTYSFPVIYRTDNRMRFNILLPLENTKTLGL